MPQTMTAPAVDPTIDAKADPKVLLSVEDLSVTLFTEDGDLPAIRNLSFVMRTGETLAVVGESGCGKSMTALSIMGLLPQPPAKIVGGSIMLGGTDLAQLSHDEMRAYRGNKISMIFQEPSTSLNPLMKIGDQLAEPLIRHKGMSKEEAHQEAIRLLGSVGIPNPEQRVKDYPYQFSGGMQQRAMIAMAMSCKPDLLIADEPTTALDVTVQAQVLEELNKMRHETNTALIIITHNLGVVARYADVVRIMYGGRIVEEGDTVQIFENPYHPYTMGLIRAVPRLDLPRSHGLHAIEGEPPDMSLVPQNCCAFCYRCPYADDYCRTHRPELEEVEPDHRCACFHMDQTEEERKEVTSI